MGQKLSEAFNEKVSGQGRYSDDSPRKRIVDLLEKELPGENFIEENTQSNRVRLQNEDFFELYKRVKDLKGEETEYLWNGNKLITKEKFRELKQKEDTSNKKLEKLWKNNTGVKACD